MAQTVFLNGSQTGIFCTVCALLSPSSFFLGEEKKDGKWQCSNSGGSLWLTVFLNYPFLSESNNIKIGL